MDKRKLEDILDALQIKINIKGYKYWIAAVEIKLKNKEINMGTLYNKIGREHNDTYGRVERALRVAYKRNSEIIKEYFAIDYEINNVVFLELLVREMERRQ